MQEPKNKLPVIGAYELITGTLVLSIVWWLGYQLVDLGWVERRAALAGVAMFTFGLMLASCGYSFRQNRRPAALACLGVSTVLAVWLTAT